MKTRLITLVLGSAIALYSCKTFEGAQVNVTPNPLEVHADSVQFKVTASIPPKAGFKKGGKYYGRLVIKGEGGEFEVGRVTIAYEQFPDIKKQGAKTSYEGKVLYQEGMNGGTLTAINRYERKKKKIDLPELPLAPCCITTSLLVDPTDQVIYLGKNVRYQTKTPITLEAKFQFPQDVYKIQPTEYEKAEIKAIGDFLSKKYEAKKVYLEGFASPEGTYKRNQFLSVHRAKEVQNWLIDQLKKYGYKVYLDSTFFSVRTTTEDWQGFLDNLNQLSIPEETKQKIIQIVSAGYDPATTERKVMALVGGAEKVEFILAPLRRATIRLEGFTGKHTNEQIDSITNAFLSNPNSVDLSKEFEQEEFMYAIQRVDDIDKRIELYRAYVRAYPKDVRGYNDLGAALIEKGLYDEALDILTQAEKMSGQSQYRYAVLNNLGVIQKQKKNYKDALTYLQTSYNAQSTPQAAYNLGVVYEKMAMYDKAAEYFGLATGIPRAKYNAGLSKLLMEDYAGAKADLESAIRENKNDALAYYVLAIVGARSADNNLMILNLKKATELDRSYAQKAAKDLEFRKYWKSQEFQTAIK